MSIPDRQGRRGDHDGPNQDMRTIWTIGHSNHDLGTFLDRLGASSIALVADVRRFPGSRRHPHFGAEALASSLSALGIEYRHVETLGGRRGKPRPGSPNTAWRVASFNAYADYMESSAFHEGLETLIELASTRRTAILCSEALPWRCHRRLIADALIVRGWTVRDILGPGPPREHALTPFAQVRDGTLVYPAEALSPDPSSASSRDEPDEARPG